MEKSEGFTTLFTSFFARLGLPSFSSVKLESQLYYLFKSQPEIFSNSIPSLKDLIENEGHFTEETTDLLMFLSEVNVEINDLVQEYLDLKSEEKCLSDIIKNAFSPKNKFEKSKIDDKIQENLRKTMEEEKKEALVKLKISQDRMNSITKSDITEIKSMKKPSSTVMFCLECVSMVFGQSSDFASAKKMICMQNFLANIMSFDINTIPEANIEKIRKKIKENPSFNIENIQKASKACVGLIYWVTSIIECHDYLKRHREINAQLEEIKESTEIEYEDHSKECGENEEFRLKQLQLDQAIGPIIERQYNIESEIKTLIHTIGSTFFPVV